MPTTANPLVTCRARAGLSRPALAVVLGCSTAVVKWSEAGCYNIIPTCYKAWNKGLVHAQVTRDYQNFRNEKRRHFGATFEFPEIPPETIQGLLRHFGLTPYGFAMRACLQHGEVFMLMQNRKVNLSSNFTAFFLTVGLSDEWIREFNSNINCLRTPGDTLK